MDEEVMDARYYRKQITGLYLIMNDTVDNQDKFVSKTYVKEKLLRILSGGIGFHPIIKEKLDKL